MFASSDIFLINLVSMWCCLIKNAGCQGPQALFSPWPSYEPTKRANYAVKQNC